MSRNLIEKQVLYDGAKVRLEVHHFEDEDGNRFKVEICAHRGAVVILPLLADGQVVLIRNFRHTIGQYLIELPAGTLNNKEPPINAAGRELLEETGYLARRLRPICTFFASPGILTEKIYAFAATELELRAPNRQTGEDIEVTTVTMQRAMDMIHSGEIVDAKTIVALMTYQRWGVVQPTLE